MGAFAEWRAEHAQRRRAAAVARVAMAEPDEDDVRWLAERGAGGDTDHARWEWRYARRAFAIVVAQRDALDDRTGSLVAAAVARAMARDPLVDSAKRAVAARQFNDRLARYADVIRDRTPGLPTAEQLTRALFAFAGQPALTPVDIARGSAAVTAMLAEAHDTLTAQFGAASLPPDVAPSALVR
ncbi:MAG TPA: hypothetical protein VNW46_11260 [Gemmatimonadaceae bacterium]|nr:hypothetical protein [Gemmatimonadaceae bacterium]